jgi:hypothetical protein
MQKKQKSPAGETAGTVQKSKAITKKMSPQQQQYYKAIGMTSPELGAAIKSATERIGQHVGNALAHDQEAKKERDEAQREFQHNIAYYYETKQRLLNPGYRTDVDGGKDRTPDENERNFGAPDWATFANKSVAYSLQHADRMLKAFAKANGLLTDEGENIDDPVPKEGEGAGRPQGRRTEDPTAQKRYEFIATAAMELANRNPEGEVEKQILAAAEYEPAPLMLVSPDLFTEVLSFITQISTSSADEGVRAKAMELVNKMRLHKPAAEPAKVPAVAAKEEKRKRDKRLAKKNGQPLGSAACNPPMNGTPEHVQRSAPAAEGRESTPSEQTSAEYRLRKAKAQREYYQRKKQAELATQAAKPAAPQEARGMAGQHAPQPAATPTPKQGASEDARKHPASVKVRVLPPALSPEVEERIHDKLSASSHHPGRRQGNFVLNEKGKYEFQPELGMGETEEIGNGQPGEQQLAPSKSMATVTRPFRVKKRIQGDIIDFAVIRDGDNLPEEVFNAESEAKAFCENLNKPPVASLVPQQANPQSAAQSAGY